VEDVFVTNRLRRACALFVIGCGLMASSAFAQTAVVTGAVHDETGGVLPGVSVELRPATGSPLLAVTDAHGSFSFDRVAPGHYEAGFLLINYGLSRKVEFDGSGAVARDR
jgi:hypothetical protein